MTTFDECKAFWCFYDRNRRVKRPWTCPRCGTHKGTLAGHRCTECKRRICCQCTDHAHGICISDTGNPGGCERVNMSNEEACRQPKGEYVG